MYPPVIKHGLLEISHLPSGYLTVRHGKWPIYRWFTWVYLLKMVIFHGYVK